MAEYYLRVNEFPWCCKAYILYGFMTDNYVYEDYNSYPIKKIAFSEDEIYNITRQEVLRNIKNNQDYREMMFIASVTIKQSIAEKVLREIGFTPFGTTYNEGSYDEEVRFFSYVSVNEDWQEEDAEEDEEYYDEDSEEE